MVAKKEPNPLTSLIARVRDHLGGSDVPWAGRGLDLASRLPAVARDLEELVRRFADFDSRYPGVVTLGPDLVALATQYGIPTAGGAAIEAPQVRSAPEARS